MNDARTQSFACVNSHTITHKRMNEKMTYTHTRIDAMTHTHTRMNRTQLRALLMRLIALKKRECALYHTHARITLNHTIHIIKSLINTRTNDCDCDECTICDLIDDVIDTIKLRIDDDLQRTNIAITNDDELIKQCNAIINNKIMNDDYYVRHCDDIKRVIAIIKSNATTRLYDAMNVLNELNENM